MNLGVGAHVGGVVGREVLADGRVERGGNGQRRPKPDDRGRDRMRHLGAVDAAEINQPRAVDPIALHVGDRGKAHHGEVAVPA